MIKPLVSASWLATELNSPSAGSPICVVDTRWYLADSEQGRREYDAHHIPGAVFLDLESDLSADIGPGRHPLPNRDTFVTMLGANGIGNDHHVIAYDHGPGAIAARLWWLLRHVGHHRTSVLDGGLGAWRSAGYGTAAAPPSYMPVDFECGPSINRTIDRHQLLEQLGSTQVIDARPTERYRGENEPVDPVAGHIPTAISAPTADNLESDGTFKSPEDLARRFAALGVDPNEPVVSSCGSGVTACHNILALHLAGFPEATLYPGSWSDWSTASFPVATGPHPGSPPG